MAEDAEMVKQQRTNAVLNAMESLLGSNRSLMARVATDTGLLLKGFSPTALAKVIAQDAELEDLITKAMFLVPAFKPENPHDPTA